MKRKFILLSVFLGLTLLPAFSFGAEAWKPKKAITILTPVPAGNHNDMTMRAMAPRLKEILGVPIVVTPTPGGQNTLAIMKVLNGKHDGYTIFMHNGTRMVLNNIFREDTFKFEDIRPICSLMTGQTVFVQHPDSGSFEDFVARAKAKNGKLNVGIIGSKTSYHAIRLAELQQAFGFKVNAVPFDGTGDIVSGILGGHLDAGFLEVVNPAVKMTLQLNTKSPMPEYADVPVLTDFGVPPSSIVSRIGLFAASDTPEEVIKTLEAAFLEAAQSSTEYQEVLNNFKLLPAVMSGSEFNDFINQGHESVIKMRDSGLIIFE